MLRRLLFIGPVVFIFSASSAKGAVPVGCSVAQFLAAPPDCTLTAWPACAVTCLGGSPGHPTQNSALSVSAMTSPNITDAGGWVYDNNPTDSSYGQVVVNCVHPNLHGIMWYVQ